VGNNKEEMKKGLGGSTKITEKGEVTFLWEEGRGR
jgi:hypothetical protein